MLSKNRKFNVAGSSFYDYSASEGELVYFQLEPQNSYDKNAIKVLNKNHNQIGHIPAKNAKEIQLFINGKYPHYCAKVVGVWEPDDSDVVIPKILAHFSNKSNELPYPEQEWVGIKKKENMSFQGNSNSSIGKNHDISKQRIFYGVIIVLIINLWVGLIKSMDAYIMPTLIALLFLAILYLVSNFMFKK